VYNLDVSRLSEDIEYPLARPVVLGIVFVSDVGFPFSKPTSTLKEARVLITNVLEV
jgi:hypothetical protein